MIPSPQFDNCGRPLRPVLSSWLDVPRILPFQETYTGSPVMTTQKRITNASPYTFYVIGLSIAPGTEVSFRVKWPNGHYMSQSALTPVESGGPTLGPVGQAGNMLALPELMEIPPGARIAVENSGVAGTLQLSFWGFLRIPGDRLNKNAQATLTRPESIAAAASSCLVGYPTNGVCPIGYLVSANASKDSAGGAGQMSAAGFPLDLALASSLRWQCNRNVMAPEWDDGNQCNTLSPTGYDAEPFPFFSDPVSLVVNAQSTNVPLIMPGVANSLTDIRRWRVLVTWASATGTPTVSLRLPNGYSITGGDQMPLTPFQWIPWFPRVPVPAGQRLLLDWGNQNGSGSGTITTRLQFDAVKLTKRSA